MDYATGQDACNSSPSPRVEGPDKQLVGVDVFLDWDEAGRDPDVLGERLRSLVCPEP